ncbi:IS3 family transposase [Streptomyces sp. NBC_01497]|uniref:IS3 family transposase n=1 Tax=Streptomyces sp. NBC_01497 TaxID=2903885 RepID=UPI003FCE2A2D
MSSKTGTRTGAARRNRNPPEAPAGDHQQAGGNLPPSGRRGCPYWRARAADQPGRQVADTALAERMRAVHRKSDGTYGVPSFTAERRERGQHVNHMRIARMMRSIGLEGCGCVAGTALRTRPQRRPPT